MNAKPDRMVVNLLCHWNGKSTLDDFSSAFFEAVGVFEFCERESGNYADGRYFKGGNEIVTFTIALSEEKGHRDFEYWVQASSDLVDFEKMVSEIEGLVRERLIPLGLSGARMINFGKHDETRFDYEPLLNS